MTDLLDVINAVAAPGAVAVSISLLVSLLVRFVTSRRLDKDVDKERIQLAKAILGESAENLPNGRLDVKSDGQAERGTDRESGQELAQEREMRPAGRLEKVAVESERFTRLLIEYYAHGLAQAKRSFAASLALSILGAGALLVGVTLAIVTVGTTGQEYATIVVSVSGAVTNAIGVMFHRQSSAALRHMEGQTRLLRQDMRVERESREARELLDKIENDSLRDKLRAALVLRLADATLPAVLSEDVDSESGIGRNDATSNVAPLKKADPRSSS